MNRVNIKYTISKSIFFLIYPFTDFLINFCGILLSYKLYRFLGIGKQVNYTNHDLIFVGILASTLLIVVLFIMGAYQNESSLLNMKEIETVIKGITISFFLFAIILVLGRYLISRYVMVLYYGLIIVSIVGIKMIWYYYLPLTGVGHLLSKRILIYGANEIGLSFYRAIMNSPKLQLKPVGFIDDCIEKTRHVFYPNGYNNTKGISVLGTQKNIPEIIKQFNIDEFYIAIPSERYSKLIDTITLLKQYAIKIGFIPDFHHLLLKDMVYTTIEGIPILFEEQTNRLIYPYCKRLLDISLAIIILFIFIPIALVISIMIKLNSNGPILFKHQRVGKGGKLFTLYKFRTMKPNVNPYDRHPIHQNDHRITTVGKWLRKTSLDEIPQIINVVKGNMSWVGPRPEMKFIVDTYTDSQKKRLTVLPGITGLWQLSGDRTKPIHENVDYDLFYIRNMSFFMDLSILINTFFFAFNGR